MDLKKQFIGLLLISMMALSYADDTYDNSTGTTYEDYDYNSESDEFEETAYDDKTENKSTLTTEPIVSNSTIESIAKNQSESIAKNQSDSTTQTVANATTVEIPVILDERFTEPETKEVIQECPQNCTCTDENSIVSCAMINKIPDNLPINTIKLTIENSSIKSIESSEIEKLINLRVLNASGNRIESIDKEAFTKLSNLETVDLSFNLLKLLDPNLFKETNLDRLNLANNPLQTTENAFLVSNTLEILDLSKCNLTSLSNDFFRNLTAITKLNLSNNTFGDDFNGHAFQYLKELQTLVINDGVSEEGVKEICDNAEGMESIIFSTYKVSCLELSSGYSFEESTSSLISSTEPTTTTKGRSSTTKKSTTNIQRTPIGNRNDIINDEPTISKTNPITDSDTKPKLPEKDNNSTIPTGDAQPKSSGINTNNILIGIIIVAVIGLIIGIICRRDCFGIKTKCCRTKRPDQPKDHYRHEETPLNKITVQD